MVSRAIFADSADHLKEREADWAERALRAKSAKKAVKVSEELMTASHEKPKLVQVWQSWCTGAVGER